MSAHLFRTGELHTEQMVRVETEAARLVKRGVKILLVDDPDATVPAIDALLRSMVAADDPAQLVVVDYVQLLQVVGHYENRTQEVSSISRGLKRMAKRLCDGQSKFRNARLSGK